MAIQPAQIVGIAGYDWLTITARADHNVSVDDVACPCGSEQDTDLSRIRPVQRYDRGGRLTKQSRQACLGSGEPYGLSERGCRHRDGLAQLVCAREQYDDAPIASIERDQATRVERDATHATFLRRVDLVFAAGFSTESAHARSLAVSAPPVSSNATPRSAPQPATSASATATACFTNPDTLSALFAATSPRTEASWSSSSVIVTLVVAIPDTIPHAPSDVHAITPRDPIGAFGRNTLPSMRSNRSFCSCAHTFVARGVGEPVRCADCCCATLLADNSLVGRCVRLRTVGELYQNGKQETFFAPVEGQLIAMLEGVEVLDLDLLNRATQAWVEGDYHRSVHREIGMPPLQRLRQAKSVGRPAPGVELLRDAFRMRQRRKQRHGDGTCSIEGTRFEIPSHYCNLESCLRQRAQCWLIEALEQLAPARATVRAHRACIQIFEQLCDPRVERLEREERFVAQA